MFNALIGRSESKKKLSLRISGIRAYNLATKDIESTSPFCEITFGKKKWHTGHQEKTQNPIWSDVNFDLGAFGEGDSFEVDCFDGKDASKELEGHVSVSLKDFQKPGSYNKQYPLAAKNKATGGIIEFDLLVEGSGFAQQVFKLPLEVVIAYQRQKYPDMIIPIFMRRALDYLRKHGLDEEGIFRKSGSLDQINAAIDALDKDFDYDFVPKLKDPHSVCGLLKRFIRDISGSIFTQEQLGNWITTFENGSQSVDSVRALLQQLPLCNREVLREVFDLAREVCARPVTKMQSNSFALVMGPNLVPLASISDSLGATISEFFVVNFAGVFTERPSAKDIQEALTRIDTQVKNAGDKDKKDKKEKKEKKEKQDKKDNGTSSGNHSLPTSNSNSLRGKQNPDALPSPNAAASANNTSSTKRPGDTSARSPVEADSSKHAAKKSAEELLASKKATPAPPASSTPASPAAAAVAASPAPVSPKPRAAAASASGPVSSAAPDDDSGEELQGERHDITEEAGTGGDAVCIYRVRGEWISGKTAGGPLSAPTWRHNQQVFVQSSETKTVKVKLIQDQEGSKELHDIGFYILKTPNNTDRRLLIISGEKPECEFKQIREYWREVRLEANQRYCIIPCTYQPGKEAPYRLLIQTEGRLQTSLSPKESEMQALEFENEWHDRTAGGCRNHPTCANNPQYLLVAKEKTSVTVILSQTEVEKFDTIGLYLLKTKDPSRKMGRITAADVVSKSEFSLSHEATLTFTLAEGSDAVLLPCTFDPGHEAPFKMTLLYSKPLKVRELRDERREVSVWSEWRPELVGGPLESACWRQNPQFFLMMFNKYRLRITLRQYVSRPEKEVARLAPIGLYLIRHDQPQRLHSVPAVDIVHTAAAAASAKVTFDVELDRSAGPYIIMPFTTDGSANARFCLSVLNLEENSTTRGFALIGANYSWQKRQFKGEWRGASAAGPQSFANPQYCLRLFGKKARVAVVLSSAAKGAYQYGVALHAATDNTRVTAGNAVYTAPLVSGVELSFERELEPGCYVLMPLQSVAGKDAAFELSVYAADGTIELDVAGTDIIKKSQAKSGKKDQNDKNFSTAFNDMQILEKLGDGSIGTVYRGKIQGREVAIKKILMVDVPDKDYFKKEINILRRAKHTSVATFHGASLLDDDALVIYELSSLGSLFNVLHVQKRELTWDQRLKLAIDAAKGVIYLHNHRRVHRHLSPWNLLVDKDLSCKVTDFAFPRKVLNAQVGSLRWCAPEVLMSYALFTDRSDSYAFGMILYELLSMQLPFEDLNPYQVGRAIDEGELPSLPKGTLKAVKRLVKDCWDREPQNRPTMQTICDKLESFIVNGKALPLVEAKK